MVDGLVRHHYQPAAATFRMRLASDVTLPLQEIEDLAGRLLGHAQPRR